MIQLTDQPIDTQEALRHVQSPQAGAVVMFLGTTRQFTAGEETRHLEYEGYHEMAMQRLTDLERQARSQWPLVGCALIHRLGRVDLGEASVLVAVSTPHRRDAFEAASWLMDMIKQDVPIWKQEHWADGRQAWVHPGSTQGDEDRADPSSRPHPPDTRPEGCR